MHENLPKFTGSRVDAATEEPRTDDGPTTGLVQFWPYPGVRETKIKTDIDIVAIHGLGGHPLKTWKDGERLWLRDFSTVSVRGDSEATKHIRPRNKVADQRNIIFICHSLRGVVFKQAFNLAHIPGPESYRYRAIAESILGVIFLGTPHRSKGSLEANWSTLLSRIATLSNIPDICSQFEKSGINCPIFSFYKLQPWHGSTVVEPSSVILRIVHEVTIPLDAHHNNICKFLTSSSQNYLAVSTCIGELIEVWSRTGESRMASTTPSSGRFDFLFDLRAVDAAEVFSLIPVYPRSSSQWLLHHCEFQSWTNLRGRQVLWLHGPPGMGKSVLMRSVVTYLEDQRRRAAKPLIWKPVHFFFNDNDRRRNTSDAFVRSVLHQIADDEATCSLLNYLESSGQIWRVRSQSEDVVIDAVDEVLRNSNGQRVTILDRLQKLLALDWSHRVRLLISSRTKAPYELTKEADIAPIDVDNDTTKQNVEDFIRTQVRKHLGRSLKSSSDGIEVEDKIIRKSKGNFLHASLAWEQFLKGMNEWSPEEIRDGLSRLDDISPDLIDAYCKLLDTIPTKYKSRARALFAILRVAKAKFDSRQLAFLATLHDQNLGSRSFRYRDLDSESRAFEDYLAEACGYIIKKNWDGSVDFAHISARDLFGASERIQTVSSKAHRTLLEYTVSNSDAHAMVHGLCMKIYQLEDRPIHEWQQQYNWVVEAEVALRRSFGPVLLSAQQIDALTDSNIRHITQISKTPCLIYALRHWFDHYDAAAPDRHLDDEMVAFLPTASAHYLHLLWIEVDPKSRSTYNEIERHQVDPKMLTQFLLADLHGWTELQEEILRVDPFQVLAVDPIVGMNALMHFAYFGRREKLLWTLQRLPAKGIPLRDLSSRYDVLHLCADQGWGDVVQMLQERHGLRSLKFDHAGRTLLHWALYHCWDLKMVNWADYTVADLDVQDRDGLTALHIAVMNLNMEAIRRLAKSGANCFLRDKKGMSPALLAAELGFRVALKFFIQMPQRDFGRTRDGASLLHLLAIWNDGPLVREFALSQKALLNAVDGQRRTPLHYAAMANNVSTMKQLLDLGTDVNLRDDNGKTALHEAIRGCAVDAALLLLKNGADHNATDAFGQNCLHLSLRYGTRDLLSQFFILGVNTNAIDHFGMRPLHRACAAGNVEDIEELLHKGADWNVSCDSRHPPLDSAVEEENIHAVAFIVLSIQNSTLGGRKKKDVLNHALKLAVEVGNTAVERLLQMAGAYVDKENIKIRQLYTPGPEREPDRWHHQWHLVSSDDSRKPFTASSPDGSQGPRGFGLSSP
ncbi:hypothetical protein MFIFM68171_02166 [Madurella fahalii]|uniref:NACHT domain-containing protein n=1 Tax=Madurella fahalii TaxID=1157608 RepID=A0ABQ0G2G8_9PEZI